MESTRIDKWLWAARFYKTRRLAHDAITAGHVHINGQRVKPARLLRRDEIVTIKKAMVEFEIVVTDLSDKRGSASVAQTLYRETPQSIVRREQIQRQRSLQAHAPAPPRRPDKRQRGRIIRFQRHNQG